MTEAFITHLTWLVEKRARPEDQATFQCDGNAWYIIPPLNGRGPYETSYMTLDDALIAWLTRP
jgi:hypothetical protein